MTEPVTEALPELVAVTDPVRDADGVTVLVTDGEGEPERVTEGDRVLLGDCDGVAVCEAVRL